VRLCLVESSQKQRALTEHFEALQLDCTVLCTRGTLLNISWGDDPFSLDSLKPEKPDSFATIKSAIEAAKQVMIATDIDDVGESIAYDIVELCKASQIPWQRLRLRELTTEAIEQAVEQANEELQHPAINRARNYALFDYALSYTHSRVTENLIVGRVESPLLALQTSTPDYFYHKADLGGRWINCVSRISNFNDLIIDDPVVTDSSESTGLSLNHIAFEVMANDPDPLGIEQALQEMYLSGNITYYRTNASDLVQHDIEKMHRSIGWPMALNSRLPQSLKTPHGTIVPLQPPGQDSHPKATGLFNYIVSHYKNKARHLASGQKSDSFNKVKSWKTTGLNSAQRGLLLLSLANLGRPSTLLSQVAKYLAHTDKNTNQLKPTACRKLNYVNEVMPELLTPKYHQELDYVLSSDKQEMTDALRIKTMKERCAELIAQPEQQPTISPKLEPQAI